jgi:hypothetical protein
MYPLLQRWLLDLAVDVEEIGSFPARPSTTFTQHVAAVRRSCHRELLQLGMWRKPLTSLIDHELPGASLTIEELVSGQGDFTARVLRLVEVMALHLEQHGYEVAATDRRCLMAIAYAANIYGGQRLGPEALTWAITNILVNAAHPHDPAWVNMLKSMRGEY